MANMFVFTKVKFRPSVMKAGKLTIDDRRRPRRNQFFYLLLNTSASYF